MHLLIETGPGNYFTMGVDSLYILDVIELELVKCVLGKYWSGSFFFFFFFVSFMERAEGGVRIAKFGPLRESIRTLLFIILQFAIK